MTENATAWTRETAAAEIGRLSTLIVTELAPIAGLYVGIEIKPDKTIRTALGDRKP